MKFMAYDETLGRWTLVDGDDWSLDHSSEGGGEVLTQQHFADEVDINTIVKRFGITGQAPFGNVNGVYGDFTGITDYDSALERIDTAKEKFMNLPPEIREKFGNDPGEMIRIANSLDEAQFMERYGSAKESSEVPNPVPPVS